MQLYNFTFNSGQMILCWEYDIDFLTSTLIYLHTHFFFCEHIQYVYYCRITVELLYKYKILKKYVYIREGITNGMKMSRINSMKNKYIPKSQGWALTC